MPHEAEAIHAEARASIARSVSARANHDGSVVVRASTTDPASLAKVLAAAARLALTIGNAAATELLRASQRNVSERRRVRPRSVPMPTRRELERAETWLKRRTDFLEKNATVTASELARLTGSQAGNSSARAHDWSKAGRVFSVNDGARERFPLFQLHEGQPIPAVATVLQLLRAKLSDWQIAFWFTTPNSWTGKWRAPAELLATEPERVVEAARHEVAEQVL